MAFKKVLISFILIYLNSEAMDCARPSKLQCKMLRHIKQERHWHDVWFSKYERGGKWTPLNKIGVNNHRFLVSERLPLISVMMGCAYGVNLNWFILLTLEVIHECTRMQRNHAEQFDDCKVKLEEIIERGKCVVLKLMRTLMFIDTENHRDMNENRFYNDLLPLYDFLTARVPIEFSGIITGGLILNQMLNESAESLRQFLISKCFPKYQLFNITETKSQYNGDPNGIYSFYIAKLNTYIGYINNHLIQLGFYYDVTTDHITFDPTRRE